MVVGSSFHGDSWGDGWCGGWWREGCDEVIVGESMICISGVDGLAGDAYGTYDGNQSILFFCKTSDDLAKHITWDQNTPREQGDALQ